MKNVNGEHKKRPPDMEIAKRLQALRLREGLSQALFAKKYRFTRRKVQGWEEGKIHLPPEALKLLNDNDSTLSAMPPLEVSDEQFSLSSMQAFQQRLAACVQEFDRILKEYSDELEKGQQENRKVS